MSEKAMTVQNENNVVKESTRDQNYVNPAVDIFETDDVLTLVADMPGVIKENLEIDVDQGILSIKASADNQIKGDSLYREFRPSGYYRQFRLLEDFDAAKADAELKNGVLTLRLPKAEAAKPRKIAVKTVH
jgi:HSP20 family molecular chaperone IbpA